MAINQIKYGAIISYVAIFFNIVISMLYTPWMIQKIGVADYGLYSLLGTFLSYFLIDFGLSHTVTRFVAKYRAEGNQDKVNNLFGLIAKVYLGFDIFIFLVLCVVYFFITDIFKGLTPDEVETFRILYVISGSFAIFNFVFMPLRGAMSAYEQFVATKSLDLLMYVGTVTLIVIALLLDGNVFDLVFINGAVALAISIIRYFLFFHKTKTVINWSYFDKQECKSLASYSVWQLLVQLSQMFRITLVPTILGIVANSTEISIFAVGRMLVGFVWTISNALNGLFLPKVTRYSEQNNNDAIYDLMLRVGRIQLFIMLFIFCGFVAVGDSFLDLWVGNSFADSYYVFIYIIVSNLLAHTLTVAYDTVLAKNCIRDTAKMTLISSLIGLALTIIVAPKYGAVGCPLATGLAMTLTQIQYMFYYQKKMGLNIKRFLCECHLKIMPLFIILTIAYMLAKPYLINDTLISLVLFGGSFIILYCLIAYFFVMNQSEKDLILGVLGKKS